MARAPGGKLPGGFRADWSVWCAAQTSPVLEPSKECPHWESVEGKQHSQRAKHAKKIGWTFVPGVGWLCPTCCELWKEGR